MDTTGIFLGQQLFYFMDIRMREMLARMEGIRNAYKILIWKVQRKTSLRRRKCRLEDDIKSDLNGIRYDGVN